MTAQTGVRQERIYSLDGIKTIAMLSIFLWHGFIHSYFIDFGARGCELLFVVSGFLVGYRYFHKDIPATWNESFKYVSKKIYKFWPLHLFTTILLMLFYYRSFSLRDICKCLISLGMLQAWSNNSEIFFAVNGVMWFLSALLFCYFMSPLLVRLIKKGLKLSLVLFALVFLVRFLIDLFMAACPGLLQISTHASPVVRCLEYLMGMLLVPAHMHIKAGAEKIKKTTRIVLFSLIEILVLCGVVYMMVFHPNLWRSVFVLVFCPPVFVFSLNEGIISKVLSLKPFQWFSSIQLEFFILHQAFIKLFEELYSYGIGNMWIQLALLFLVILITSAAYHVLLTDRLAKLMESAVSRITMKKAGN